MNDSDLAMLIALAVVAAVWLLPIFMILFSRRVTGREKLAWILLFILFSWFSWAFYLLLAPIRSPARTQARQEHTPRASEPKTALVRRFCERGTRGAISAQLSKHATEPSPIQ